MSKCHFGSRSRFALASLTLFLAEAGCAGQDPDPTLTGYYGQRSASQLTVGGTGGLLGGTGGLPSSQTGGAIVATGGAPAVMGGTLSTGGTLGAGGIVSGTGGSVVATGGGVGTGGNIGSGGVTSTGGDVPPSTGPTQLLISLTTATQNGAYAPKNVGAVWIEDSQGKWVYTTNYWNSQLNSGKVTRYTGVGGPTYCKDIFGLAWVVQPPPDVVTGATLNAHESHSGTWKLVDSNGATVPDGTYHVLVEVTEDDTAGAVVDFEFEKGPNAVTLTPPDSNYYKSVKLELK